VFATGVYAQIEKWDPDQQKAKKGSIHEVIGIKCPASVINARIAEYQEAIETCFTSCSLRNEMPLSKDLKEMVNEELCHIEEEKEAVKPKSKTLEDLFEEFLFTCGRQKNWNDIAKEKYEQAMMHLTTSNPGITIRSITIDTMYKLRDWYIDNDYKNRTINKQIVMLKSFLRWINQQEGYSIPADVLNFRTNLKVISKTVTFLHYDELIAFSQFKFCNKRLEKARDLWCFMAFTSLRYSDLAALHVTDIIDDEKISLYTEKTDELITVPLCENAKQILKKYKRHHKKDGLVFDVLSNQKLNDYIKEAAKEAGLNRIIVDTYYVGTKRLRETHRFYEIISCHDARRTFVSCSLAMGIPPEVVMKATGHHDYKTMKPYIATSDETQVREMSKWNQQQYRSQILTILDRANDNELLEILDECRRIVE
jgi:integrase